MPSARNAPSALSVGQSEDDIAILVVGGIGRGDDRYVEMLSYHLESNNPWRWRKLAPLIDSNLTRPGMQLLSGRRVLIVGGCSEMTEVFRLPIDENDPGQWTNIEMSTTRELGFTYPVTFKGRALVFGKH